MYCRHCDIILLLYYICVITLHSEYIFRFIYYLRIYFVSITLLKHRCTYTYRYINMRDTIYTHTKIVSQNILTETVWVDMDEQSILEGRKGQFKTILPLL